MKTRRIIGTLMILAALGVCFGGMAMDYGLGEAIKIWGTVLLLVALFFGGATLLFH